MVFYIGLSFLSNMQKSMPQSNRFMEGRYILDMLDQKVFSHKKTKEKFIKTEQSGRPYFGDCHADFNISHSIQMTAVSFSALELSEKDKYTSPAIYRTGCDIEYVNNKKQHKEIIDNFFSVEEQSYIEEAVSDLEKTSRFYHIWTLKECFLKANGLSVFDIKESPIFRLNDKNKISEKRKSGKMEKMPTYFYIFINLPKSVFNNLNFFLYELETDFSEKYILAAVIEKTDAIIQPIQPEILWFSSEELSLKSIAQIKAVESPVNTVNPKI